MHHVNPTCGDEVTLRVDLRDGVVGDISYESQGCSISQASASVMADLVIGKSVEEARGVQETFLRLMQAKLDAPTSPRSTRRCWRTPSRSPASRSTRHA